MFSNFHLNNRSFIQGNKEAVKYFVLDDGQVISVNSDS